MAALYDSRQTGPRYHVTTRVNGQTVQFQHRIEDPFVRQTVTVGWRDILRSLLHRRSLVVEVLVDGDREVIDAVIALDENYR